MLQGTYLEQIAKQDGPLALAKGAVLLDELDQLADLLVHPSEETAFGHEIDQKISGRARGKSP